MTTPRAVLVAQLQTLIDDALPDDAQDKVVVEAYADDIGTVWRNTVMVAQDVVRPSPEVPRVLANFGRQVREYTFQLWLITPQTIAGPSDDELDAFLEDVLQVLDDAANMRWTEARRGVFAPTEQPAYIITAPVVVQSTPPSPAHQEEPAP